MVNYTGICRLRQSQLKLHVWLVAAVQPISLKILAGKIQGSNQSHVRSLMLLVPLQQKPELGLADLLSELALLSLDLFQVLPPPLEPPPRVVAASALRCRYSRPIGASAPLLLLPLPLPLL